MGYAIWDRVDGWQPIERMVCIAMSRRRVYRVAATHLSGPCAIDGTVLTVSVLARHGVRPVWEALVTLSSPAMAPAARATTATSVEEDDGLCWRADGAVRTVCLPSQSVVLSTTALGGRSSLTTLPTMSIPRGGRAAPRRIAVTSGPGSHDVEGFGSSVWDRLVGGHIGVLAAWPMGDRRDVRTVVSTSRPRPIVGRAEPAMYESGRAVDDPIVSVSN